MSITIKRIQHIENDNLTVIEFETELGIFNRIGMPGNVTDEQEIVDHILADYKITQEQLDNECDPHPDYLAQEYRYKRAAEYPSIGDQLDALFHAGVFPAELAAQIQEIKNKYPKGTE